MRKIILTTTFIIIFAFIFSRKKCMPLHKEFFENFFEKLKFIIIELNTRENHLG